ncbi:MAG TPA: glycosyltransferase family 1 protein [Cytophagales bacterium]|nr:glycosyltransferase family 1 protein [Cytophagales bacterium]
MILVSGLFIYPTKVGGAENYFYNLLKGLTTLKEESNYQLLLQEKFKDKFDPVVNKYQSQFVNLNVNRGVYEYLTPFLLKDFKKYFKFFFPNYITPLLNNNHASYYTTIHDLLYKNYPEFFKPTKRNWLYLSHLNTLYHAQKVIVPSEFVKNDIVKHFGSKYEPKIEVIHNPIDMTRFDNKGNNVNGKTLNFPYIFSVANLYPHKNTLTLIKAFKLFNKHYPDVKLVLTGQLPDNLKGELYLDYQKKLKEFIQSDPNIIITGYVDEDYLAYLYRNCLYFVFPSLFEGFGMPPVEAMGLGIPTITTRVSSIEEVTQKKAIYMDDPTNQIELMEKMIYTYENLDKLKAQFREQASSIIQPFKPEVIAKKYHNLMAA